MSKNRATAARGAAAFSALLLAGTLFAPAASADGQDDSAYAIAASGIVNVPKTPHVVDSGDESLVAVDLPPGADAILHAGVFNAEAKEAYAKSSAAELRLGLPGAPVIAAELIAAECDNLEGSTSLVTLRIGEQEMKLDQIPANTPVIPEQLEGIASITLNKQVEEDGALTVTALSVDLLKSTQTVDIASATCTEKTAPPTTTEPPESPEPEEPGDDNGGGGSGTKPDEHGKAPTPTPQPGHLDVTG